MGGGGGVTDYGWVLVRRRETVDGVGRMAQVGIKSMGIGGSRFKTIED